MDGKGAKRPSTARIQSVLQKGAASTRIRQHAALSPAKEGNLSVRSTTDVQKHYDEAFPNFLEFLSDVMEDNPSKKDGGGVVGPDLNKARDAAKARRVRREAGRKTRGEEPKKIVTYDNASDIRNDLLRYIRACGEDLAAKLEAWGKSRDEVEALKEEVARLKAENEAALARAVAAEAEVARLQALNAGLAKDNKGILAERDESRQRVVELEVRLAEEAAAKTALEVRIAELEAGSAAKDGEVANLKEVLAERDAKITELEAANAVLQVRITAVPAPVAAAAPGISAAEKAALEARITQLQAEAVRRAVEDAAKTQKIADLEAQLAEALKKNTDMAALLARMRAELEANQALDRTVEELRAAVAAKEREMRDLQASSKTREEADEAVKRTAQEELVRKAAELEALKAKLAEKEALMREELFGLTRRFYDEFTAFKEEWRSRAEPVVGAPAPKAVVTHEVGVGTSEESDAGDLGEGEPEPSPDMGSRGMDLPGTDLKEEEVYEEVVSEFDVESESESDHPFDINNFDFAMLLTSATQKSFQKNQGGLPEDRRRALFKSFISALGRVLEGEKLTKTDLSSLEAMHNNNYLDDTIKELGGEEKKHDFNIAALIKNNKQFAVKFFEWTDKEVEAINKKSSEYSASRPESSPGAPIASWQVQNMNNSLESIRRAAEGDRG